MSNKRKLGKNEVVEESEEDEELVEQIRKKSKPPMTHKEMQIEKLNQDYASLIKVLDKNELEHDDDDLENQVMFALNYFKANFPPQFEQDLPPIIHLHQIYSLISSRTRVDREIDNLRAKKLIILFKFDSSVNNQSETLVCFFADYKDYVMRRDTISSTSNKSLVDMYLNRILVDEATHQLSIEKSHLIFKYKLDEKQISTLVQSGLLALKSATHFWFSIPGFGKFRRQLLESRKSLLDLVRRQSYKEMNVRHFYDYLHISKNKNFKNVNRIGANYLICDLIGNEVLVKIDSPIGLTIKINC